jgi:hypothetical protein
MEQIPPQQLKSSPVHIALSLAQDAPHSVESTQ